MQPLVLDPTRQMATDGRTLVVDYDDDLYSLRYDNPVWCNVSSNWPSKEVWAGEWLPAMERSISDAALVTCTTGYLANVLRQYSDNVVVLPNRLAAGLLASDPPLRRAATRPRVGWPGAATRPQDVSHA